MMTPRNNQTIDDARGDELDAFIAARARALNATPMVVALAISVFIGGVMIVSQC